MITALLVDDEPKAIDRLSEMLEAVESIDVIGRASSVDEAERFLRGRAPDVVFLDITMPGRLGVDLLGSIPQGTAVVFVTAREGYAVEAFRSGAVDYVLKPFDHDRLAITVERLEKRFAANEGRGTGEPAAADLGGDRTKAREISGDEGQAVRLASGRGAGFVVVPYATIAWIEAVQNYTRVQIIGEQLTVVRRTMQEWEAILPPAFARISRSLIVQVPMIRSTQWQSRDQMLVFFAGLDEPLPIGRTPMARLKDLLRLS
ncbi:MAG: LytTR family DNA-binding domain-containing protein [Planctomycetaceae bacterium]|jgi:two-component system LytT family response regulator|nr:LytTR family DNA-binding domain-containing protein [Planctomycetaceae bacterium]